MSINIVTQVLQYISPDLVMKVAKLLGLERMVAEKAISAMLPGVLGNLVTSAAKPEGARQIADVAGALDANFLGNIGSILGSANQTAFADEGGRLVNQVIGDGAAASLTSMVAKYAGISDAASKGLAGVIGPIAIGAVGDIARKNKLDAGGIASLLSSQKDTIALAFPADLATTLGAAAPAWALPNLSTGSLGTIVTQATTTASSAVDAAKKAAESIGVPAATISSATVAATVAAAKQIAEGVADPGKIAAVVTTGAVASAKSVLASAGEVASTVVGAATTSGMTDAAKSVTTAASEASKTVVGATASGVTGAAKTVTSATVEAAKVVTGAAQSTAGSVTPAPRTLATGAGRGTEHISHGRMPEVTWKWVIPALLVLFSGVLWWWTDSVKQQQFALAEKVRIELEVKAKAAAAAEAKRKADEVATRAKAEADASARAAAEAKAKVEAEAKAKAEADARTKAAADAEAKRMADAEAKRLADTDVETARLKAEAEARYKAQLAAAVAAADARRIVEIDAENARLQAEAESRNKAQLAAAIAAGDARRKAEAEAEARRIQIDAEARAKAQLEATLAAKAAREKAEAEAKARADAEARQKAETETRARAEAEARKKAEADAATARARAEAEVTAAAAKAKAEADAKRLADIKLCQDNVTVAAKSGPIRFQTARAALAPASTATLDRLAAAIKACPFAKIRVEGHTDSDGAADRNKVLSEERAKSVAEYLNKAGVDKAQLVTFGFGQDKPVAANDTDANKSLNRRIDFVVEGN